ncbi:MAG: endopeptidase La [Ruminococcus sp.]|jgi:ATP-dependent Lon protease|nr:endopeptidase La [Ruminococcus sp.]MBQ2474927.1 endopeptidase La [Ruminococcus sp.]MBQ4179598.1 endopeptidase La [Ruminococcus sp.]MBQ5641309.1 endopeptidase La [Ruminococcus sp.]MBQ5686301.1 endopeptidase La [Ruminococcus sp.]
MEGYENNTLSLPVLPLRGMVVFPKAVIHFDVGRKQSIAAINKAMREDQLIFLAAQKDPVVNDPKLIDLYSIGVVAKIVQVLKQPDDVTRVVLEGKYRAKAVSPVFDPKHMLAEVAPVAEQKMPLTAADIALIRSVKNQFEKYLEVTPKMPPDIIFKVALCKYPGELADYIASTMYLDYQTKQSILEIFDPFERLNTVLDVLVDETYISKLEREIEIKAKSRIDESQQLYFLREQKRAIEEQLGEDDDPSADAEDYADQIEKLELEEKTTETLMKECRKLMKMPFGSQEASVIRTYLDTVLELPWHTATEDKIVLSKIRRELDKSHFGLEKIKDRIIEQLAVRKLSDKQKGQVLCFVGPPGVGKTSIAQSIAKAIGRNSQRIALGGVKDEAEIRGHRRTYLGSMPGRIMAAVQNAGSNNPLLILDEIDKLASDYKGDPTSALLEVLDIEQNNKFVDHYIDVPFDLSNVMFITTANDLGMIPAPLRDRMEIIELNSYTREEKFHIAKKHLIPKQLDLCGFSSKEIKFTQKAIYALIDYYTRESGVRTLEREIASLLRKCAVKKLDGEAETFKIDEKTVEELLGKKKYLPDQLSKKDEVGVVNGLAWTSVGGELLPIEVAVMDGTGKIVLTGSLGDVMQESAKAAITCIRSHAKLLGIDSDFYKTKDIHIHAPEGAVPKDGPSAGITMATAIYSALADKPVRHDVAMTGEITLRGKVLAIGGLKEKSMAAYKYGIDTVFIPKQNERDISEFDTAVREKVHFIPVENFTDVIAGATAQ